MTSYDENFFWLLQFLSPLNKYNNDEMACHRCKSRGLVNLFKTENRFKILKAGAVFPLEKIWRMNNSFQPNLILLRENYKWRVKNWIKELPAIVANCLFEIPSIKILGVRIPKSRQNCGQWSPACWLQLSNV